MVGYIGPEAERFLKSYWLQRSDLSAEHYSEQMGTFELFGRQPAAFEANKNELNEGLITPTMSMLDMVILTIFRLLCRVQTGQGLIRSILPDLQTRRHLRRPLLVDAQ